MKGTNATTQHGGIDYESKTKDQGTRGINQSLGKETMRKLLKPLLPVLYAYLKSEAGKKLIISLLKAAAKQTNNKLDDQAINYVETRLWPDSNITSS